METPFAIYDALCAIAVPPEKVRSVVQSLEHDMALFATRTQFDQLDRFSGSRYELLRAEIEATRQRIEQVDKRFEHVDKRFDALKEDLVSMEKRIENRVTLTVGSMVAGGVMLVTALLTIFK